jgi:hypothetical protein
VVKEYDLFIPLRHNDGAPIAPRIFQDLQRTLVGQFGGLTYFPQPNEGFWRLGNVTYRDEIVVYRVVASEVASARRFLKRLKKRLKVSLAQEEILIVERNVRLL